MLTMAPGRPAAISAAATARPARNVPRRLIASTSSHSPGVRSSSGAILYTPAELTSTSGGPFSSPAARVTAAATAPGSRTSQATGEAPMPAEDRASAPRSSSTTSAPSACSRRAQARPIAPAPPVMSARRPAIRPGITVLAEPDATVDPDRLAGDVPGVRRDQPGHRARDVVAGAVAAERDGGLDHRHLLVEGGPGPRGAGSELVPVHLGRHVAGGDRVGPDTVRRKLQREGVRQQRDARLGRAVPGAAGHALLAEHRP